MTSRSGLDQRQPPRSGPFSGESLPYLYLPKALLRYALTAAQALRDEGDRAKAVASLIPRLAELGYQAKALATARALVKAEYYFQYRAEALARMAPYLPLVKRRAVLREALADTRTLGDVKEQSATLASLVPYLAEARFPEALALARMLANPRDHPRGLASLASRLAELGDLEHAFEAACAVPDAWHRDRVLNSLASQLAELRYPADALAAAHMISEDERALGLAGVVACLPEAERGTIVREALTAVSVLPNGLVQAEALAKLAPYLSEALLHEALALAGAVAYPWNGMAMAGLLPRLAELGSSAEALELVQSLKFALTRERALVGLAPYLSGALLDKALKLASTFEEEEQRAEALAGLAPYLSAPQLREVLTLVQMLPEEQAKATALAGLAPYLSDALLREALTAAQALTYAWEQGKAQARLAVRLAELGHPAEALTLARALRDKDNQVEALVGLLPHLPKVERETIIHEALAATWSRELIPYLRELSLDTLYSFWRKLLPIVAARPRRDLLEDLQALAPIIAMLGQHEAIAETCRAIQDVCRWWP